ncbi:MAG TPA: hypothetical protein PKY22_01750, partial [Accumulibacter sp.]|nr:hypothetical protein [Accumulibacter sp.]
MRRRLPYAGNRGFDFHRTTVTVSVSRAQNLTADRCSRHWIAKSHSKRTAHQPHNRDSMKERLSGQIDLNKLFDTRSAPLPLATLAWRGEDIACDDSAVCVMIGSPSLHSAGDSLTTRQPTSAALLLAAWQRSGRAMVDQLGGSYACTITNTVKGQIVLRKETIPAGSSQHFSFTASFTTTQIALSDG